MSAIERWLEGLAKAYKAETDEDFIKRCTGWKASADTPALLFACLKELQGIRETLERQTDAANGPAKR